MKTNQTDEEIRETRDALMRECGGDLKRFGDLRRESQPRWAAAGHALVSFAGQRPLELPLPDWEKIDAEPENEIISEIREARRQIMAERGGDLHKLFESIRAEEEEPSAVLREEPPKT